jgi:hypothetical protein
MNLSKLQVSIGVDLTQMQQGLAQAQRSLQEFGKKMTATGAIMSKALTAPITAFGGLSVRAFMKQEDAERKLAAAIQATGGQVDANMARFTKFATELQNVTRVGDETTLGLLQIATAQGLSADSAERATRNAIAMQSAFNVGAESAIRMTAALEQGDATMLRRYIPALRGVTDEAEMLTKAHEILAGAFDIAKADAQTFGGQLEQLKNLFGDFQEQIGSVIAEALTPFVRRAKEIVQGLKDMDRETLKVKVAIGAFIASIGPAIFIVGKLAIAISALATPIGAVVGVVALASVLIIRNWDEVVVYFTNGNGAKMWVNLKNIVDSTAKAISNIWNKLGEDFITISETSFGGALIVIEKTLDSINTIMQKFNRDFSSELNIFEDNILTTFGKIDAKLVWECQRRLNWVLKQLTIRLIRLISLNPNRNLVDSLSA